MSYTGLKYEFNTSSWAAYQIAAVLHWPEADTWSVHTVSRELSSLPITWWRCSTPPPPTPRRPNRPTPKALPQNSTWNHQTCQWKPHNYCLLRIHTSAPLHPIPALNMSLPLILEPPPSSDRKLVREVHVWPTASWAVYQSLIGGGRHYHHHQLQKGPIDQPPKPRHKTPPETATLAGRNSYSRYHLRIRTSAPSHLTPTSNIYIYILR